VIYKSFKNDDTLFENEKPWSLKFGFYFFGPMFVVMGLYCVYELLVLNSSSIWDLINAFWLTSGGILISIDHYYEMERRKSFLLN